MSCCNKCESKTSLGDVLAQLEKIIEMKVDAEIEKLKLAAGGNSSTGISKAQLEALVLKAEQAAQMATAMKEHCQTSVSAIDASMALMSEKLADGYNMMEEFTVNGKTYKFKHGILVEVV